MPEIKHNFTGGKMNKDLDERIVPNGQYRDAMNIQVSTSDGSAVGVVQNILGNEPGCTYTGVDINPILPGSSTIASISDEKHDTLYWFVSGPNFNKFDVRKKINDGLTIATPKYNKDLIMRKTPSGCEPVVVDISSVLARIDPGTEIQYDSLNDYQLVIPISQSNVQYDQTQYIGAVYSQIEGVHCGCGGNYYSPTGVLINGGVPGLAVGDNVSGTNIPLGAFVTAITQLNSTTYITISDVPVIPNWKQGPSGSTAWPFVTEIVFTRHVGTTYSTPTWFGIQVPEVAVGMSVVAVGPNGYSNPAKVVSIDEESSINTELPTKTAYLYSLHVPSSGDLIMNSQDDFDKVNIGDNLTIEFLSPNGWNGIGENTNEFFTVLGKNQATQRINIGDYTDLEWANFQGPGPGAIRIILITPVMTTTGPATIKIDRDLHLTDPNLAQTTGLPRPPTPLLELWHGPYEYFYFYKDRVLNFDKDKLITGVNIIDDMLFWTDNNTEPKKVNIPRSIEGTDVSGGKHTKLVNSSLNISPKTSTSIKIPLLESHITVIKKSPKTQLTLGLNQARDPLKNYSGIIETTSNRSLHDYEEKDIILIGENGFFAINTDILGNTDVELFAEGENRWENGTNVVLKEYNEDGEIPNVPIGTNYRIKGQIVDGVGNNLQTRQGLKFGVEITSIEGEIPRAAPGESLNWVIDYFQEEKDFLENKFARFSYRYKYEDGEYSTFAPFTQVAFIPGAFDYHPTKGYNLGMTNKLTSINLSNFVTDDMPLDVVEIDLLYKEDVSPNIYIVDTINPKEKDADGNNIWDTNIYTITSDTISGVLPSNQLLRPWDNVPRKALAQEVTGNRLVYANYLQNYNLLTPSGIPFHPNFKHQIKNSEPNFDRKSIKSLREYQLGVVFTDKYGRETPVISNSTGTFKLDKTAANQENKLQVGFGGNINSVPIDFEYYKFFIKETSGEYYNLAMDRFYNAEDGNYWLAFPSLERNKVDIDTFLILKKGPESDGLIAEQARYKILAIENEAPDFIKTKVLNIASGSSSGVEDENGVEVERGLFSADSMVDCPQKGQNNFSCYWEPLGNTAASNMHDIKDDLYIEFSLKGTTETSNRYRVSSVTRDNAYEQPDDDTQFHITIDGFFGDDISFIANNPADPSNILITTEITIYKHVVENSPKFDGRFFVKIYADPTFNDKMNVNAQLTSKNFRPHGSIQARKMYFMRKSFDTDHKPFFDGGLLLGNDPSAYPYPEDGDWWSSGIVNDAGLRKGIGAGPNQDTLSANGCEDCRGLGTLSWATSAAPDVSYYNTQDLNQQDANLDPHTGYGSKTQSTWFDNHKYFKSFFGPYTAARPKDIENTATSSILVREGCCDPLAVNTSTKVGNQWIPNNKEDGSICLYTNEFLLDRLDEAAILQATDDPEFNGYYGFAQEYTQYLEDGAIGSVLYNSQGHYEGKLYGLPTLPYNGTSETQSDGSNTWITNKDYIWGEVDENGDLITGSGIFESANLAVAPFINYNFEEVPGPNGTQADLENNFVTFIDAGPYVESQSSGDNAMHFSYNYDDTFLPDEYKGSFNGESPMNHGKTNNYKRGGVTNMSDNRAKFRLGWGGIDSIGNRDIWKNSNNWLWYETDKKNWWALGQDVQLTGAEDRGKYHFIRDFLQGFQPGAQFRWKEDPTQTVYTIYQHNSADADMNLVNYSAGEIGGEHNQNILDQADDPHLYGQSNWPKASTYLKPYNFRRSKEFEVYPSVTWNPSPNDGFLGPIPGGAKIDKYLPLPSSANFIDSSTPINLVASGNFSTSLFTFTINTSNFGRSWDTQATNGLMPITKGMILTHVGGVELTPPLLINQISPNNSGNETIIELVGYTAILDGSTEIGGGKAKELVVNETLTFQQPTMNGFSPASASHISSLYPGGKIGAVGYDWEFVEPIDTENILPDNPAIWETEPKPSADIDIYYEISGTNPTKLNKNTIKTVLPVGSTLSSKETIKGNGPTGIKIVANDSAKGDIIFLSGALYVGSAPGNNPIQKGSVFNVTRPDGTSVSVTVRSWTPMEAPNDNRAFTFKLDTSLYKSQYVLDWHNCYSFKNGVESNRIRDTFNLPYVFNGVRASTTLEGQYKEERRKSGLIYSGIYNSNSGVNNLNQFIQAEKITKDVNPIYGSIQKLHSRDSDLVTLCEDKVLRILANKDALFNADGNPQLTATNNVLGQTIPFSGEFGISTNPESFASESYRVYFADKVRGAILRLSKDGLTPVSMYGMKDWFKDNLKIGTKIVGSYDDKKDEYNVTISSNPPTGSIVVNSSDARASLQSGYQPAFLDLEELNSWFEGEEFEKRTIKVVGLNGNVLELDSVINDAGGFNLHFNSDGTYDNGILTFSHDGLKIGTARVMDLYNSYEADNVYVFDGGYSVLPRFSRFITISELSLAKTVSFREDIKGWVSFKSFIPEIGNSMANDYYTFVGGNLFKHHIENDELASYLETSVESRNTFYGNFTPSSIDVLLNDGPSVVKSFSTLNYEGSQTKVTTNHDDDQYFNLSDKKGWYAESFETDKEKGSLKEFVEKEGKWFGYLKGQSVITNEDNSVLVNDDGSSSFDQASFAIQGIGTANNVEHMPCIGIQGCTDPNASNYDINAVCNNGTCVNIVSYPTGCTDPNASNYDSEAIVDDGSCLIALPSWDCLKGNCEDPGNGLGQYALLSDCRDACQTIPLPSWNCVELGDCQDPGNGTGQFTTLLACQNTCVASNQGCTNPNATNYDPNATVDDGSCINIITYPTGCTNPTASNYDPLAVIDDGSCVLESKPPK